MADQDIRDYVEALDEQTSRVALSRARASNIRTEQFLSALGEDVPEPQPSFIQEFFDTLDTGGQFVRGIIAKGLGEEGFADKGFIDAGIHGTQEDLTVGDLLRKNDFFKEHNILRGVTGFVGDVLTDPLTFLTLGGGIGARAGGKALSKAPIKLADGTTKTALQVKKSLQAQNLAEGLADLAGGSLDDVLSSFGVKNFDDLLNFKKSDDLLDGVKKLAGGNISKSDAELLGDIIKNQSMAAKNSGKPFQQAVANIKLKDRVKKAGGLLSKEGVELESQQLLRQTAAIKDKMGLAADESLESLFMKPGIRYSNPFAGLLGSGNDWGPFSRSAELPFITTASEKVIQSLKGPLYNANVKVGRFSRKALEELEKIPGVRYPAKAMGLLAKVPGSLARNLSRRVQAGGKESLGIIEEYQVARALAAMEADDFVNKAFSSLDSLMDAEQADSVYRTMQATFDSVTSNVPKGALDKLDEAGKAAFHNRQAIKALDKVRDTVEAIKPGAGQVARDLMERIQGQGMRSWREVEVNLGLGDVVLENYLRHAYDVGGDAGARSTHSNAIDHFIQTNRKNAGVEQSFNKHRKYDSFSAALSQKGFVPKYNYKEAVRERLMQHKVAVAERELYERMSTEIALPLDVRKKVESLVAQKNTKVAEAAIEFLREMDIDKAPFLSKAIKTIGPEELDSATAAAASRFNFKFRDKGKDAALGGEFLTLERYDALAQGVALGDKNSIAAARKLGLTRFDDSRRNLVKTMDGFYQEFQRGLLGREGEGALTRSAAIPTHTAMRTRILKSKNTSKEVKMWMQGVVPRSFNNAFADALQTESLLKTMTNGLRAKGAVGVADAFDAFAGAAKSWVSALKLGSTVFWPAFHLRNFNSAQLMGVQEAALLGEQLNPRRMAETFMLRKGKGYLKTIDGSIVPAQQLVDELRRFGVINEDALKALDILSSQREVLKAYEEAAGPILSALEKGTKIPKGVWDTIAQKGLKFTSFVENYGREHLYVGLRRAGHDPQTAANLTNQTMVNYARGKTRMERDLLNNVFFFYSFARTSTANQMKALVTRPGALTAQLHAVDGIKEVLMDPDALPLPADELRDLQTVRGAETISRFLRYSDEGNPVFLQNVGLPAEESTRFFNLRAPETLTMGDIINAGLEGGQRTMKTIVSQVNPLIKGPLEIMIGRNLFFDRPLDDKFLTKVPKLADNLPQLSEITFGMIPPDKMPDTFFRGLDKVTQTFLDARDNGDGTFRANPIRLALVAALTPGLDRLRTSSRAMLNDDTPVNERMMRFFLGMKTQEVKPEQAKIFARREELVRKARRVGADTRTNFQKTMAIRNASKEE